jgi:hypothetical protein
MKKPDGWAYCPEDGRPDRLVRFVHAADDAPVALYVASQNLVFVNRRHCDALDSIDQGRVLATNQDLFATVRDGKVSISNR